MTTSLTPSSISVIPEDGKPTEDQFVYFNRRFRNELHGEVLRCFMIEQRNHGLTRAELARRLSKDPAQVTRWLGAPKNLTVESVNELLLAMGYIPLVSAKKVSEISRSNAYHPLAATAPPARLDPVSVAGSRVTRFRVDAVEHAA